MVKQYQNSLNVAKFYIGRGFDKEARRKAHGADRIIDLYQTESTTYVKTVEENLIKAFMGTRKCDNDSPSSNGPVKEGVINYVYIAWWIPRIFGLGQIPRRQTRD